MFSKKAKKHPYVSLAIFSFAAAGMISLTNKAKRFMKDRICCMKKMFEKKMSGN